MVNSIYVWFCWGVLENVAVLNLSKIQIYVLQNFTWCWFNGKSITSMTLSSRSTREGQDHELKRVIMSSNLKNSQTQVLYNTQNHKFVISRMKKKRFSLHEKNYLNRYYQRNQEALQLNGKITLAPIKQ